MQTKTYKLLNTSTRQALFERVHGYVDKSQNMELIMNQIRENYHLDRIYRFDLGENPNGCSPKIKEWIQPILQENSFYTRLGAYPDRNYNDLKQKIAARFSVSPSWILMGNGLDSMIDLICRIFIEPHDRYLMPVPSFYLFEEYSEKMGASPIFCRLSEDDHYRWTDSITDHFKELINRFHPKLIWIANPNNPTGQFIPLSTIETIIDYARLFNCFVVVDEAYGEYCDNPEQIASATNFLSDYNNLMVLRTFSKQYGLAGARVGYLMCPSQDILDAIRLQQHHFPISGFSVELAQLALDDRDFLEQSRQQNIRLRERLFEGLNLLSSFGYIPSSTNFYMLKNNHFSGAELMEQFQSFGIITASLAISGLRDKGYLRITVRNQEDNDYFLNACMAIDHRTNSM